MRNAMSLTVGLLAVGAALGQVQHGAINVVENDSGNNPSSVTLTRVGGAGTWTIDGATSNRGDYTVLFNSGSDITTGVLVVGVYQTDRSEPSVAQNPYFATPSTERNLTSTNYFIALHESPTGSEVNFNVSLGYFPIADGWLAANLYNSANNGPITTVIGNPTLVLRDETTFTGVGNEVVDDTATSGFYLLSFEGLDLRRDGIILTSGGKNEDNRAAVFTNFDGRAIINCIDNGSEGGGENDGAGFVFIPDGTSGVVMGQVTASGRTLYRQGNFTIDLVGQPTLNGTYRLTIPGQSPATGTLLVSPHSELAGTTVDNPIFVRPDGDTWIIETRDIEPLPTGLTLQDLTSGDIFMHFAFLPNNGSIVPGVPSKSYVPRLCETVSARFEMTEFTPDNGLGDNRTDRTAGSDALDVFGDNRGDIAIGWLNARLAAWTDNGLDTLEGFLMATASEFIRDNSATGGQSGWSTVSVDNSEIHLHLANPVGGEINSNFAVSFFPVAAGFQYDADVIADNGVDSVIVPGNATTDGVLIGVNWDNNNRIISATPNGGQYDILFWDGATGALVTDSTEYGYVYIPYGSDGIVAGQVAADGSIISGTGFTTSTGVDGAFGFPVTLINIPGVNAATDGVLQLTSLNGPFSMAWEVGAGGAFEVAGIDLASGAPGQAAFAFAYVPYTIACASVSCDGDVNGDGFVDINDLNLLLASFGLAQGNPGYNGDADFNGDNVVDINDLNLLLAAFNTACA